MSVKSKVKRCNKEILRCSKEIKQLKSELEAERLSNNRLKLKLDNQKVDSKRKDIIEKFLIHYLFREVGSINCAARMDDRELNFLEDFKVELEQDPYTASYKIRVRRNY